MTKISSSTTRIYKKVFPLAWFGGLAIFLVVAVLTGAATKDPMLLLVPVGMGVFGYVLMRMLIFDLADEVLDGGDFLVVRQRGHEDRVPLSNIMNVSASTNTSPERVTLRLATPGRFGAQFTFIPQRPFVFNPFTNSPIVEDLIVRVDRARSKRRPGR